MSEKISLEGRTALVTGASAGIGREVALALAREGVRVALLARSGRTLEEVAKEIGRAGGEALPVAADLRDEEAVAAAFERVVRDFGGVDILVNSAGLGKPAPLVSGAAADFREIVEVNLLAPMITTRAAVADMRRRGAAGHVVHISSMSAHRVQAGGGVYAATKHGVRAITEGLRQELRALASPIRVTAISPADTYSEFMDRYWGSAEEAAKHLPPYRKLDAKDVASAVLYAVSAPPHVEIHDILLRPIDQPD
jgi:NADP-dependent 3-hydroxy acid dehydrogenase YdfG